MSSARFRITISKDTRNNTVNAGVTFTLVPGSRDFTISQPDYIQVGDRISEPGRGVGRMAIEKVNATTYRDASAPPIGAVWRIDFLQRPMTNFSAWEILEATFQVDNSLTISPNDTVTIVNPNFGNRLDTSPGKTTFLSMSSSLGNASSFGAVATGSTMAGIGGFGITASRGKGSSMSSTLSADSNNWKGSVGNIIGCSVPNIGHGTNLTIDSVTDAMTSFQSTGYINSGKVTHVHGVFLNQTSMHAANAATTAMSDTVWGIYQINDIRGALGTKMAKNMFNGNVLIQAIDNIYDYATFYAAADQRLVVVGNIRATGTVTQNSDITLKKDIAEITGAVAKLSQIRSVTYKWIDPKNHGDDETEQLGVIAQEVEKVFPQAVSTDNGGIKSVSYGDMVSPVIAAIKELKAEIDALKAELAKK